MTRRDPNPKVQALLDDQLVEPKVFAGPPPIRLIPEGELYRFEDYEKNKPRPTPAPRLRRRGHPLMNRTALVILIMYAAVCALAIIVAVSAAPSTP